MVLQELRSPAPAPSNIQRFKVTPTITAGAYSANDVIGGRLEFVGFQRGTLQSITICDNANQAVDYILVFFESQPTDIADNAPGDVADADLEKIIYSDTLLDSSDKKAFVDNSFVFLYNLDVPMRGDGSNIWAFLITTGTPTYAAITDITVTIQVETTGKRSVLSA